MLKTENWMTQYCLYNNVQSCYIILLFNTLKYLITSVLKEKVDKVQIGILNLIQSTSLFQDTCT